MLKLKASTEVVIVRDIVNLYRDYACLKSIRPFIGQCIGDASGQKVGCNKVILDALTARKFTQYLIRLRIAGVLLSAMIVMMLDIIKRLPVVSTHEKCKGDVQNRVRLIPSKPLASMSEMRSEKKAYGQHDSFHNLIIPENVEGASGKAYAFN
jgi:hypothetical protein